ncbi:hypothetical protein [Bradyrhizobium sp. ORS 285]|uniref:hypothetical protein n=1 Tax=Bradyrhizobium sp. ORS 285 TaxID=115808 RepID=UPI00352E4E54
MRNDSAVEVDTDGSSVPGRLIAERVAVTIAAGEDRIRNGAQEIAIYKQVEGRRMRIVGSVHFDGVAGRNGAVRRTEVVTPTEAVRLSPPSLLRPPADYKAAIGGSF